MNKINNSKFYVRLPLFLALALVCGIFIGAVMSNNARNVDIVESARKYGQILTLIQNEYVDTVNVEELVDYSIVKMLEKLDPHTAYIPKSEIDMARSVLEGDFEGIGIEFNIIKDTIYVVTPISGGPSEEVGLQAGDKIVKVDGKVIAGTHITNPDVFKLLRGPKGTKVKVGIKRKGSKNLLDFVITRDKIPTYSVDVSYMIDSITGYIKVSRFAANTYEEFRQALIELKGKGMQRLMLDLRDNPGGYLDKATKMTDELLAGKKMIVYTDGKQDQYDQKYYADFQGTFEKGPVIVLVNEGSASASEIVSGALQDNDRALLIGRRTFGKGLVQLPINLTDGSEIRLTISRYYTPSGRSIQKHYDANSSEEYGADMLKRYQHGEFFHQDSIKFADSLKFKTSKGRTVYGGGGVMPDIFVPRDTTAYTQYMIDLFNKNVIREYTLDYFFNNKPELQKMTVEQFQKNFKVTDKMMQDIVDLGTKSGVKFKESDYAKSKEFLRVNAKAYIARSLYGNKGFFPIINLSDEVFLAAIKNWDKAKSIEKGKF